jgi:hypothetical protein
VGAEVGVDVGREELPSTLRPIPSPIRKVTNDLVP